MKKLNKAISLLLLSLSISTYANDYELGVFQLNRGEFKAAIAEFTPLVEQKYAPAMHQMGLIHLNGWGVRKSPDKAFEYFSLAASQNYPDSLFELATMYSEGISVNKDLKTAFTLTEKAAKKNLTSAQFNLGVMYMNGTGVKQDDLKAARWYQQAADRNYALAQFNLALMYYEGKGVEKSTEMSYIWNIIAARNGYEPAAKSRDMDEHRLDITQIEVSRKRADELYKKIIDQADKRAKKAQQRSLLTQ